MQWQVDSKRKGVGDPFFCLLHLEAGEALGLLQAGVLPSVEQVKRVAIGVEMVANPAVLFLDEPTSAGVPTKFTVFNSEAKEAKENVALKRSCRGKICVFFLYKNNRLC